MLQGTLAVPVDRRRDLPTSPAHRSYNFLLNGEVLLGKKLFDSFRYKFDFPVSTEPARLRRRTSRDAGCAAVAAARPAIPLVFERYLRPGNYTLMLKLEDLNGGAFFRTSIADRGAVGRGPDGAGRWIPRASRSSPRPTPRSRAATTRSRSSGRAATCRPAWCASTP